VNAGPFETVAALPSRLNATINSAVDTNIRIQLQSSPHNHTATNTLLPAWIPTPQACGSRQSNQTQQNHSPKRSQASGVTHFELISARVVRKHVILILLLYSRHHGTADSKANQQEHAYERGQHTALHCTGQQGLQETQAMRLVTTESCKQNGSLLERATFRATKRSDRHCG
jgi:hypothetical protein